MPGGEGQESSSALPPLWMMDLSYSQFNGLKTRVRMSSLPRRSPRAKEYYIINN